MYRDYPIRPVPADLTQATWEQWRKDRDLIAWFSPSESCEKVPENPVAYYVDRRCQERFRIEDVMNLRMVG